MTHNRIRVLVETTPRRVFVSALDWPGLSRAGRDEPAAIGALLDAAPRYAEVARAAGEAFETDDLVIEVEERRDGDATTAFGAPSIVADADRRPVAAREAARLAAIVEASWAAFDRIAAAAPEELPQGPARGRPRPHEGRGARPRGRRQLRERDRHPGR